MTLAGLVGLGLGAGLVATLTKTSRARPIWARLLIFVGVALTVMASTVLILAVLEYYRVR